MNIKRCVNPDKFWLFSYGTLMLDRMKERFNATSVTNAYIKGYKVIEDGHLKLVQSDDPESIVTGLILEYDMSEKPFLDMYEGLMYKMQSVDAYTCGNITGGYQWKCNVYVKNI